MPRLHQDTIFPTILYFAGAEEETAVVESAAAEAGALLDVWHFNPTLELPHYLGADNSEAARAKRVAGALRWENANIVAISDQLPDERIRSAAESAHHLKRPAALITGEQPEADWVAHNRFSLLRVATATALGDLVHAYLEDEKNSRQ